MSTTNRYIEVRILRRRNEAEGIISLELGTPDGTLLPAFEAGAHIDVHLPSGLVRQYSLCNDPAERHRYRLGILLEPNGNGGSAEVHRDFIEGQNIRISAPRNNFQLFEGARHSVLIAGGIGITPILAMAYRLHAMGKSFELHYLTRTHSRTAFLEDIAKAEFSSQIHIHHDDGPVEQRFDAVRDLPASQPDVHLYVCGPKGMMDAVIKASEVRGWMQDHVHLEYFAASADKGGEGFIVEARRSGKTVVVPPGRTIAEVLIAAGVEVPLSCEEGVCGTCITNVIEGIPDHRDIYQTSEQKATNRQITPCCSRSLTAKLVLDI